MTRASRVGRLARAFAWIVVTFRWLVLALWVLAAVAAVVYLPGFDRAEQSRLESLVPSDSEALRTEQRASERFGLPLLSRVQIVQRDPDGLSPRAQVRVLARAAKLDLHGFPRYRALLGAIPILNTAGLFPSSTERSTTAITYLFLDQELDPDIQTQAAEDFARREIDLPGDHLVGVTGSVPARSEQGTRIYAALPLVEVGTVVFIGLVVGLHFRAVGPPLATLAAAGLAYLVAMRVLTWFGQREHLSIPSEVEPVIVVLVLGVVTDYSIFFLSGMRHRLSRTGSRREAAISTVAEFSPIIFTAGLIVAASTFALLAATLGFFRALGPGLAITVAVALLVSVTFVPAVIATFGRALYWPSLPPAAPSELPEPRDAHERPETPEEGTKRTIRARLVSWITRKPVAALVAVVGVGLLLVAAAGMRHTELGISLLDELPPGAEAARAAHAASEGFAPGITSPTEVVVTGAGAGDDDRALSHLNALLARQPAVAGVVGPGTLPEPLTPPVFVAEDGDAARFVVILKDDPLGSRGIADLRDLEDAMPSLLRRAGLGGAEASFAGDTALARETVDRTVDDLGRIALAALLVSFVLLVMFLRAVVAPLYLLAASVLAVAAALGLTTFVFQDWLGHPGLTYYMPFAAAVLLVALGSDYNVFVVGRIWEEARVLPPRDAVREAVPRASRAIGVAGIAMAGSFALLGLVPLLPFREFAFAMVVGILLDSFLVRSFLVPSLITLFGRASYWPRGGPKRAVRAEDARSPQPAVARTTEARPS